MNEETKPDIDALIKQIQGDQEQVVKTKTVEIPLMLSQLELLALAWHFYQQNPDGSFVRDNRVTTKSFDWGTCPAQHIQAAVVGTGSLQQKILKLLLSTQDKKE